ncbi:MAG: carbohydrate ABC transporter permease [Pseudanabaenaceae cyanobacterium]
MYKWLINSGLWLGAGLMILPLVSVFLVSFVNSDPQAHLFTNYLKAWMQANFLLAFFNSALVASVVTGLQIFTSLLAGYALARLDFSGKRIILLAILATLIIPVQLLVVPIFLILRVGHLINTYGALIIPSAANAYGIFLLRQYIQTIPIELEQAAILDGANRWQILSQIIFPLTRPAIVTLFLFTFIGEWNDLFKPLIFTTRPELMTVQLTLASFQQLYTADWSLLMAAVVIASLPVVLLFFFGQKQLIRGIATTGLKN